MAPNWFAYVDNVNLIGNYIRPIEVKFLLGYWYSSKHRKNKVYRSRISLGHDGK